MILLRICKTHLQSGGSVLAELCTALFLSVPQLSIYTLRNTHRIAAWWWTILDCLARRSQHWRTPKTSSRLGTFGSGACGLGEPSLVYTRLYSNVTLDVAIGKINCFFLVFFHVWFLPTSKSNWAYRLVSPVYQRKTRTKPHAVFFIAQQF